jgi:ComF family protein
MRINGWGLMDDIISLIYPKRCIFCDAVINYENKRYLCKECERKYTFLEEHICEKCGKPLNNHRLSYCYDCLKQDHIYTMGRAVYEYKGDVKEAIYRYKYYNRKEYGKIFAQMINRYYLNNLYWELDLIIAIPLHQDKFNKRGYNQSAVIATHLGKLMGIAVNNNLLIRRKNTLPQKELSDRGRISNVKNAFYYNSDEICGNNILLIDDIYTTGSTIDSAASTLKANGAQNIYFLTIAIGKGF